MKNLLTLPNDSSFAAEFSISVSKTRANLLFTMKITKMFELPQAYQGCDPLNIKRDNPAKISRNNA